MNVAQFFAQTLGKTCAGKHECRWCAAPCTDQYHQYMWPEIIVPRSGANQPAPIKECCKRPANHYVCQGCYLYRRQRVTLAYLDGQQLDRQAARHHSWLITRYGLTIIRPELDLNLKNFLLKPPHEFALSLIDKVPNQIQLAVLNQFKEIKAETPIQFTMNGTLMSYSVYELQEALKSGDQGKEPGVRLLLKWIGGKEPKKEEEPRGRGRPPVDDSKSIKRIVTLASGGKQK